jgi:hypothetical protein
MTHTLLPVRTDRGGIALPATDPHPNPSPIAMGEGLSIAKIVGKPTIPTPVSLFGGSGALQHHAQIVSFRGTRNLGVLRIAVPVSRDASLRSA